METSCCIADEQVCFAVSCRMDCIKDNSRRVCVFFVFDDFNTSTLSPNFQLVNGCRTERICRCQQYRLAFVFEVMGKFPDGCGLTNTIDTDDQHHCRRRQIFFFLYPILQNGCNLINEHIFDDRRVCGTFFFHTLTQVFHNVHSGLHAHICHDKGFFQFFKQILVNLRKAAQNGIYAAQNVLSGFIQPFFQTGKKAFFLFHGSWCFFGNSFKFSCCCFFHNFFFLLRFQFFCYKISQFFHKLLSFCVRFFHEFFFSGFHLQFSFAFCCRFQTFFHQFCQFFCKGFRIFRHNGFFCSQFDFHFGFFFRCGNIIIFLIQCAAGFFVELNFFLVHDFMDCLIDGGCGTQIFINIQNDVFFFFRSSVHLNAGNLHNVFFFSLFHHRLFLRFFLQKIKKSHIFTSN